MNKMMITKERERERGCRWGNDGEAKVIICFHFQSMSMMRTTAIGWKMGITIISKIRTIIKRTISERGVADGEMMGRCKGDHLLSFSKLRIDGDANQSKLWWWSWGWGWCCWGWGWRGWGCVNLEQWSWCARRARWSKWYGQTRSCWTTLLHWPQY